MQPGENTAAMQAFIEAMPGAKLSDAKVSGVRIYKVMGKMFVILSVKGRESVNLKCDTHLIDILKAQYSGVGHRGHLDHRFWIDVRLDADVPMVQIEGLVQASYALICQGLTKAQRATLALVN